MLSKHFSFRLPLLLIFTLVILSTVFSQSSEPAPSPTPVAKPDVAVSATTDTAPALNTPQALPEIKIAPENTIHFGDIIEVDVVGSVENDWRGQVNPEGFINGLGLGVDPVFALCQSEQSVLEKVALAYGKYLRNPEIIVRIVDRSARPVATMLGAVRTQQTYRIKRMIKLNELIALAGGIVDTASGEVQIFRPAKLSCGEDDSAAFSQAADDGARYIKVKLSDLITGKPEANPIVRPGDMITVQEATSIYVTGGVNYPQTIFARQEMSVSRAIATAGGAVKGADTKKVVIYRRKGTEMASIDVDLSKIEAKQAEDVILQAFDIVEVPQAGRDPKRQQPIIPLMPVKSQTGVGLPVVVVD